MSRVPLALTACLALAACPATSPTGKARPGASPFSFVSPSVPLPSGATPAPAASASATPVPLGSQGLPIPTATPTAFIATPTPGPSSVHCATDGSEPTPLPPAAASGPAWPAAAHPATATPPHGTGKGVATLVGTVYDDSNAALEGVTVRVTSLDAGTPYTASATTSHGFWTVFNVPAGVALELVAARPGYTSRRRVGSFGATTRTALDFGGLGDLGGAALFLSKYPEIVSAVPTAEGCQVTFSAAFDATNQARIAAALRLFPANAAAAPADDGAQNGGYILDLAARGVVPGQPNLLFDRPVDPASPYVPATLPNHPSAGSSRAATNLPWDYAIQVGTHFPDAAKPAATVTWDATGSVATLALPFALQADHLVPAAYQVGLVASADRILDQQGDQLGTNLQGGHLDIPVAGALLHGTARRDLLAVGPQDLAGTTRFAVTHQDAARFDLPLDAVPPKLLSASYAAVGTDARLALKFDKPMAAYDGRPGGYLATAWRDGRVLDGLTFALGSQAGATAHITLPGTPRGISTGDTTPLAPGTEVLKFLRGPFTVRPRTALVAGSFATCGDTGRITAAIAPTDPTTIELYFFRRSGLFAATVKELKLRLENAPDPAGNLCAATTVTCLVP